jgi:hypothetical protein
MAAAFAQLAGVDVAGDDGGGQRPSSAGDCAASVVVVYNAQIAIIARNTILSSSIATS